MGHTHIGLWSNPKFINFAGATNQSINLFLWQVWTIAWWMKLFGARSPKRHVGYSNSRAIVRLDVGQLKRSKEDRKSDTTVSYRDSRGQKRFKGSKTLKATECMPQSSDGIGVGGYHVANSIG